MTFSALSSGRMFSLQQLKNFNGEDGPMYIAFHGKIYDVTDCSHWKSGIHEFLHFPGQDLTREFSEAPHGEEVFRSPCVKLIGYLTEDTKPVDGTPGS